MTAARRLVRTTRGIALTLGAALALAGCEGAQTEEVGATEDDLTSNTALARELTFTGAVFVDASASNTTIQDAIYSQTQSAFGALRESNLTVNERELGWVDAKTWIKTPLDVVDPATGKVTGKTLRVSYTYKDTAIMPKTFAKRSALSLGLLHGKYESQVQRVLKECTSNDKHAQDFATSVWYVFDPALSQCKAAMAAEQKLIDAQRVKAKATALQVVPSEVGRLYLPMTARLTGSKTNNRKSYPEYDRLWSGGVQKGRLVIASVNGMLGDWHAGGQTEIVDDEGYGEWFQQIRAFFQARPGFKLAKSDPPVDLSTVTVGGKTYTGLTFDQIMQMELDGTGFPAGVSYADRKALKVEIGKKLYQRWLTFEAPVTVKIGSKAAVKVTIQYDTYFGAGSSSTPHKRGIKQADVFLYNGHSYIGYGPLDPTNFSSSDFPSTYQILFIDSCVSYNYYEKDFFKIKKGGSQNLELITNGLETWTTGSGAALGKFLGALLAAKPTSYKDLLTASEVPYAYDWGGDALRVVDGELDNVYSPTKTPITVAQ